MPTAVRWHGAARGLGLSPRPDRGPASGGGLIARSAAPNLHGAVPVDGGWNQAAGIASGTATGKLHVIGDLEIRVLGRGQRPAHVHVPHPDGDALIDIFSLALLRGTLSRRHRQDVLAWAALHRDISVAEWNRLASSALGPGDRRAAA